MQKEHSDLPSTASELLARTVGPYTTPGAHLVERMNHTVSLTPVEYSLSYHRVKHRGNGLHSAICSLCMAIAANYIAFSNFGFESRQ